MRHVGSALERGGKYLAAGLIALPLVYATKGDVRPETLELGVAGVSLLVGFGSAYFAVAILWAGMQYYEHFFGSRGETA